VIGSVHDPRIPGRCPDRRTCSLTDMLLVDWDLLPSTPVAAFEELRNACPQALVIVLISHLDVRQQAALSAGADAFISKGETPERVAERLRSVAAIIRRE
jgi:DNA-binding NarL/FixJ family response regulator